MLSLTGSAEIPREQMTGFLKAATLNRNPDIDLIAGVYYDYAPFLGLRPDTAICQMIEETSEKDPAIGKWLPLTSWWSQAPRRNFAGIGVTGHSANPGRQDLKPHVNLSQGIDWFWNDEKDIWLQGISFANLTSSVLGHLYHLYLYGSGNQPSCQAQFFNSRVFYSYTTRTQARSPLARTVQDLSGTWAADKTYGTKIEAKFNEVKSWKGK